jgi:hypothetical protein
VDQIVTTRDVWQAGNPALAHLPRDDRAVRGLIVVPESLYMVNHAVIRDALPAAPFDIAIVSLSELEQLVAAMLHERSGAVLADAMRGTGVIVSDVQTALMRAQRRCGRPPSNPILDDSVQRMRW